MSLTLAALYALTLATQTSGPPTFTPKAVGSRVIIEDWSHGLANWQRVDPNFPSAPVDGAMPEGSESNLRLRGVDEKYLPSRRSSNAETGVAISKAFDLSSLQSISVRVAGGNDGKCYVALLVDGKEVRKASGDNSFTPVAATWDVSEFKGKMGEIEILDQSVDPRFGWVALVGKVEAERENVNVKPLRPLPGPDIISNYQFTPHGWTGRFPNSEHISLPASTDINRFEGLQDTIWKTVTEKVKFRQGESVKSLASRICFEVDRVLSAIHERGITDDPFLMRWMRAEGVSAWVYCNVGYDYHLATSNPGLTNSYTSGQLILDMDKPMSICSGIALLTRDLGRAAGLKCFYVGGFTRDPGADISSQASSNHAWVCFDFGGNTLVPADTTSASFNRNRVFRSIPTGATGKLSRDVILPDSRAEWEVFLSCYYARDEAPMRYGDEQSVLPLMDVDFQSWIRANTSNVVAAFNAFRKLDAEIINEGSN